MTTRIHLEVSCLNCNAFNYIDGGYCWRCGDALQEELFDAIRGGDDSRVRTRATDALEPDL